MGCYQSMHHLSDILGKLFLNGYTGVNNTIEDVNYEVPDYHEHRNQKEYELCNREVPR